MTFTMDVGSRVRQPSGRQRRPTLMPMWLVLALVVALIVAAVSVTLAAAATLIAAAGSVIVGGVLLLAFVAVVNTLTPFAFFVIAARVVGVAVVARAVPAAFEIIMVAEACFYVYFRIKSRRFRKVKARGPRMTREERESHWRRVLDNTPDMEAYFRGWFVDEPPLAAIRRDNVVEWLAWAYFNESVDKMSVAQLAVMHQMLDKVTEQHDISFSAGYNPDVTSKRLNLDRHRYLHRPLLYYGVVYLMDFLSGFLLRGMGFRRYKLGGGNPNFYWYRPAPAPGTQGKGVFTVVATAMRRLRTLPSMIMRLPYRLFYTVRPPWQASDTESDHEGPRRQTGRGYANFAAAAVASARLHRRRPRATTTDDILHDSDDETWAPSSTGRTNSGGGGSGDGDDTSGRTTASASANGDVVVFFHGIGIGVSAYLLLIWDLLSLRQATCVVEVPNISTRLVHQVTTPTQVVGTVGTMLHRHGHKRCSLVGHSFGSIHAAWVIRHMPDAVLGSVFLDPVCFMLAEPDVCHNFMYRRPTSLDQLGTHLMASTELHISHSIGRHFFWHQNVLWHEQLPHAGNRTSVLLSGRDAIVPCDKVRAYLELRKVDVMYYPHLTHGAFMADSSIRWRVVQATARHHNCEEDLADSLGDMAVFWMSDDWTTALGW